MPLGALPTVGSSLPRGYKTCLFGIETVALGLPDGSPARSRVAAIWLQPNRQGPTFDSGGSLLERIKTGAMPLAYQIAFHQALPHRSTQRRIHHFFERTSCSI